MRLVLAAAALLLCLPLHAEDSDVSRFDAFMRKWTEIAAKREKGDRKSFDVKVVEPDGFEYKARVDTTVGRTTEDGEKVVVKHATIEDVEKLQERASALPAIVVGDRWEEPLPVTYPDDARITVEEGVELKVGDATLKCTKLTSEQDGTEGLKIRMEIWITDQDNLGVVRMVSESGPSRSLACTLKKWSVAAK
ncbi:MAG: hypothetical protein HYY18_20390 [Planctomycetes bacterium]|nr:hypothetical protein [Planctomycetota bacterium]